MLLRRRILSVVARACVIVAPLWPSCTCPEEPIPYDGGRRDAGRDASAARDAARDVPPDVPPSGGWVRVAASPTPGCQFDEADDELVATTRFPVEPCPDRDACRRIVASWPMTTLLRFRVYWESAATVGGRRVLVLARIEDDYSYTWLVDDEGRPLRGYRTPRATCGMGSPVVSDDAMLFSLTDYSDGDRVFLFAADHGRETRGLGEHLLPGFEQGLLTDEGWGAVWTDALTVERLALDGSVEPEVVSNPLEVSTLMDLDGSTIFFNVFDGARLDLVVAPLGAPSHAFTDRTRSSTSLTTDGADMAWLEFDYPGPPTLLAADRADVRPASPQLLEVFTEGFVSSGEPEIRVGHGYVAYTAWSADFVRVYRLADGYRATIVRPGDEYFHRVSYVGPDELAVTTSAAGLPTTTEQLLFIRLDSVDWQAPL